MHKVISKICRICLCDGSRNIFEKKSTETSQQFAMPSIAQNVSSLDRLLEKLRYVTMMKVDESENLPKYLCDSCIVQLNVAYNFKRNAVESDIKIRQYIIEYGMSINPNQYSLLNANNLLLPASNFMSTPSLASFSGGLIAHNRMNGSVNGSSSGSHNGHTDDQSSTQTPNDDRPFPVMPLIIKEEPVDFETLSDITIDTNTEAYACEERLHCRTDLTPSAAGTEATNNRDPTPINGSMVTLNDKSLLISMASSDVDYISAYLPTPSASEHSPVESTSSSVQIVQPRGSRLGADGLKTRKPRARMDAACLDAAQCMYDAGMMRKRTRSALNNEAQTTRNVQTTKHEKRRSTRETPVYAGNNTDTETDEKPNRQSLQRQLNKLEINMLTEQRAPVRFDQRGSRIKDGVLEKKEYHSFFRKRSINPLNKDVRNGIKEISRKQSNYHQDSGSYNGKRPAAIRRSPLASTKARGPSKRAGNDQESSATTRSAHT